MAYPKLQALADKNARAANEMVTEIARGVHAGNECITSQAAAKSALETAEEILVQLAPDESDVDLEDALSGDDD